MDCHWLLLDEERAKGIKVADWLVDLKVDVVFLKESLQSNGPVYVFGDAAVEVRSTAAQTLDQALEAAREEDAR